MHSALVLPILSQVATPVAASAHVASALSTLSTIDLVVAGGAALALAVLGLRRAVWGYRGSFAVAPPRPNRLEFDALAVALSVYLVAVLSLTSVMQWVIGNSDSVLSTLVVGGGGQLAGGAACLAIAAGAFDGGVRSFLIGHRPIRPKAAVVLVLSIGLIGIGLCPVISEATLRLILLFSPRYTPPPHATIESLRDRTLPTGLVALLWFAAVVVAPVAEELFFRGLVQTVMLRAIGNRWLAIALTSTVFGLIHVSQPYAMVALAVLAVLLGYAYERSGSLIPPIVIHSAFNLKTLIWESLSRSWT